MFSKLPSKIPVRQKGASRQQTSKDAVRSASDAEKKNGLIVLSSQKMPQEILKLRLKLYEVEQRLACERERNKKLELDLKTSEEKKAKAFKMPDSEKVLAQKLMKSLRNEREKKQEQKNVKDIVPDHKEDLGKVEVNVESLKKETANLRKEKNDLKGRLEKLSNENKSLRFDLVLSGSEITKLEYSLQIKEKEIQRLKSNIQNSNESNGMKVAKSEKELHLAESKVSVTDKEIQKKESSVYLFNNTIHSLGEAIRQSKLEIRRLCESSKQTLARLGNEGNTSKLDLDECQVSRRDTFAETDLPISDLTVKQNSENEVENGSSETHKSYEDDKELHDEDEFVSKYLFSSSSKYAAVNPELGIEEVLTEEKANSMPSELEHENKADDFSMYLCTSVNQVDDEDFDIEKLLDSI